MFWELRKTNLLSSVLMGIPVPPESVTLEALDIALADFNFTIVDDDQFGEPIGRLACEAV